jgi:hypothetical protein
MVGRQRSPERGAVPDEPGSATSELASPACSMAEADPAYMGFAAKDELIERLNLLLEAERAGAKVLLALMREHEAAAAALAAMQRDEGRYAGLLTRLVRELGGEPSRKTGDFVGKVLALPDLHARLELLNRGQLWVAKRLDELLPRLRDDAMHAALREMRDRHHGNIAECNKLIATLR